MRRHWPVVTAAAVFVLGLSGATVLALRQAQVAKAEARKAQEEAEKSDRVTKFLRSMLTSTYKNGGTDVTVAQMLNAAEASIAASWKNDPLAEATLRESLGASYVTLVQPDRARFQLERALALFQSLGRHVDAADTLLVLGINAQKASAQPAADYYQRALDELQRAGKDAPPALLFRVKVYLAGVLIDGFYRLPEGSALLDQAVALAAHNPAIPRDQLPAAWTHQGGVLVEQGRFDEADALFRQAIAADNHTFDAWTGLARSNFLRQRFPAAAEFARRNYELTASYNQNDLADAGEAAVEWARYRAEAGETAVAVAQIRSVMPEIRKEYPTGGMMLARYLQAAAQVFNRAGLFEPAAQYASEALDRLRQVHVAGEHPSIAACLEEQGIALAGLKRYREAIPLLEQALRIDRGLGPAYARTADNIEKVLTQAGTHE